MRRFFLPARRVVWGALSLGALLLASSCQTDSPQTGSQTNWLRACDSSSECGDFSCLCGTCTVSCDASSACEGPTPSSCIDVAEPGAIAACDGALPSESMCLPRCEDGPCPEGTTCVAGVCTGARAATASVSLDPETTYQSLLGLGASVAYNEDLILGHPDASALFDAMFLESGFEMIRLANRFSGSNPGDLAAASEIIQQATERLGQAPLVFITSGSPPSALKANGDPYCYNSNVDCTLVRTETNEFDYPGFAEYWRSSLAAYANAGVVPDYVSIQNNADFIPGDEIGIEACRFLGAEGTASVTQPNGNSVEAEFPGYDQAMAAVAQAVSTLPDDYSFSGPEVGSAVQVPVYAESLSETDSISYHLYGMSPTEVSLSQLEAIRDLSEMSGKPSIQSEMQSNGIDTARLAHYALAVAGSSAYLQQAFVSDSPDPNLQVLIGTDGTSIEKRPAYHALAHFSRHTERGWRRFEAESDSSALLSSGWIAPEGDAFTVILVNSGDSALDVALTLSGPLASLLDRASVTRTTFDGEERSASLGVLSESAILRLPGRSIVTVAATTD